MCSQGIQIKGNRIVAVNSLSRGLFFLISINLRKTWVCLLRGWAGVGSSTGPASLGAAATGWHRGQPLVHVHCCFSAAGGEVATMGESLAVVLLVWNPCVYCIFFSWTCSSCLNFWRGLTLLRGVKKLSPFFFRIQTYPSVSVSVVEGGRFGQGWRQGQFCASCRHTGSVLHAGRDPSSPGIAALVLLQ